MKFSVISACYNTAEYIAETIESIIYQKGDFEIEYIIIDGNSTDGTKEIVENYIDLVNKKLISIKCNNLYFKFISEDDNGMYDAIAKGFKAATGDVISYINADDFYLPNAFSTIHTIFSKYSNVNWITGMNTFFNENGQITEVFLPFNYQRKLIKNGIYGTVLPFIQQESTFWRKRLLNNINMEKLSEFILAGDYFLWHNFSMESELYIVKSCLAGFRVRKNQLSSLMRKQYNMEFTKISAGIEKSFSYYVSIGIQKILWHMPDKIKIRMNKKIIFFDNNEWILPETSCG